MREVVLVPDAEEDEPFLAVVVRHPTGVRYHQQYGGTACLQGSVEGYAVHVEFPARALAELVPLFVDELRGAGVGRRDRAMVVERVRPVVAGLRYTVVAGDEWREAGMRLDEERVEELDEAWVPVVTDGGPGVLMWGNSD